ncbi:hypothetical protein FOCC_FOCC017756 [Frankliniella occidentalis]|nr:hypothetical protein FOCC_FOCC017756 [Frankliniella occidentalis]
MQVIWIVLNGALRLRGFTPRTRFPSSWAARTTTSSRSSGKTSSGPRMGSRRRRLPTTTTAYPAKSRIWRPRSTSSRDASSPTWMRTWRS